MTQKTIIVTSITSVVTLTVGLTIGRTTAHLSPEDAQARYGLVSGSELDSLRSRYEKSVAEDAMGRGQEELANEVRRLSAENRQLQTELTNAHEQDTAQLQELVADRQRTIESLITDIDTANCQLDRKQGSLERIQLDNERFHEIQDSQVASQQSRIDQLIVELAAERERSEDAQSEVRRLSSARSGRIAFLARQREQLLVELSGR